MSYTSISFQIDDPSALSVRFVPGENAYAYLHYEIDIPGGNWMATDLQCSPIETIGDATAATIWAKIAALAIQCADFHAERAAAGDAPLEVADIVAGAVQPAPELAPSPETHPLIAAGAPEIPSTLEEVYEGERHCVHGVYLDEAQCPDCIAALDAAAADEDSRERRSL